MRIGNKNGFTLMEMLVVIAIIAVLVAIAIPLYSNYVDEAKAATDEANIRGGEAAVVAQYYSDGAPESASYVFDAQSGQARRQGEGESPVGYGQSSVEVEGAEGIPNKNGVARYLLYTLSEGGNEFSARWSGTVRQVTSIEQYKTMSTEDKIAIDEELLDSLEEALSSMTYSEIDELRKEAGIDRYENGREFRIAVSSINKNTYETGKNNRIVVKSLFEKIGFTSAESDEQMYLVNSILNSGNDVSIKVYLPKKVGDYGAQIAKENLSDKKAEGVVVWIKAENSGTVPYQLTLDGRSS